MRFGLQFFILFMILLSFSHQAWALWVEESTPQSESLTTEEQQLFTDGVTAMVFGQKDRAQIKLKPLAEKGYLDAQMALATLYKDSPGEIAQYESLRWYWAAAHQNSWRAQKEVGLAFMKGIQVPRDLLKAHYWLYLAAEQGEVFEELLTLDEAIQYQGQLHYQNGEYLQARPLLQLSAEQGYLDAMLNLASIYRYGLGGTPVDKAQAVIWLRKAATKGSASAKLDLALMGLKEGVSQIHAGEAVALLREAANPGNATAQYELAQLYAKGTETLEVDLPKSNEYLSYAATQGHLESQYQLGVNYSLGKGVKKDESEAFHWFKQAASQGDPRSEYNLGLMYHYGLGIKPDTKEGQAWLQKAANQNYNKAKLALTRIRPVVVPETTSPLTESKNASSNPVPSPTTRQTQSPVVVSSDKIPVESKNQLQKNDFSIEVLNNSYPWLMAQDRNHYILQLFISNNEKYLRNFIKKYNLEQHKDVLIYVMKKNGDKKYILQTGVYSGYSLALKASVLWKDVANVNPWIRPVKEIQKLISENIKS